MSFSTVSINLHSVHHFNDKLATDWVNPTPPTENGTIVLIDASWSMKDKSQVCRLVCSALKCCSGTQGLWHVPAPSGTTALVDAANEIHAKGIQGVNKIVLVTDGEDTASTADKLIKRVLADGTSEFQEFHKEFESFGNWMSKAYSAAELAAMSEEGRSAALQRFYEARKAFFDQKCTDVATHISNLKIEMCVVAVGSEVKDFVSAMCKAGQRINVAHIDSGATAREVIGQVSAVVRRPRRQAGNTVAITPILATEARSDDVAAELGDAQVSAVETEADATQVGDAEGDARGDDARAQYDPSKLLGYMDAVLEQEAVKYAQDPRDVREAVAAFVCLLIGDNHADLPGPIVCSKFGGLFKDPAESGGKKSKFQTCISSCLSLLSKPCDDQRVRTALADDLAAGLVGPVFVRTGAKDSATAIGLGNSDDANSTGYDFSDPMFFKFTKAAHYAINASMAGAGLTGFRAAIAADPNWPSGDEKRLEVWKGNSTSGAYHKAKAASPPPENPPAATQPVSQPTPTSGAKRPYRELEEENAALKVELDGLKAKLARFKNAIASLAATDE